jgi:hypothetical protein
MQWTLLLTSDLLDIGFRGEIHGSAAKRDLSVTLEARIENYRGRIPLEDIAKRRIRERWDKAKVELIILPRKAHS